LDYHQTSWPLAVEFGVHPLAGCAAFGVPAGDAADSGEDDALAPWQVAGIDVHGSVGYSSLTSLASGWSLASRTIDQEHMSAFC
jgi:hypothetical protein